MPELEGTILGSYHLQHRLGHGGMAEVYLAHDMGEDREVAVKVLCGTNEEYLERFRREARAIDRLAHDHILPVFDYGDQELWHYLVMLYAPAGTLRDLLANGPLKPEEANQLLQQIADALQFAHDHGILHRDVKPSNILLQDHHYAYLADFGLAKVLEESSELTRSGILLGTPEYMAPDLADGPATVSTDVYALAVLLYEAVTGCVPFVADTPIAVFWKQIRDYPLPPSRHNPQLPAAVDEVVLRGLDKDPHARFQTAKELADAYSWAISATEEYEIKEVLLSNCSIQEPGFVEQSEPQVDMVPGIATQSPNRRMRLAAQWHKLILPGNFSATPKIVRKVHVPAIKVTPLPSLPMRSPMQTPEPPHESPQPAVQYQQVYHNPYRQKVLTTSIVAFGLLLFIVLPMSYLYYLSRSADKAPGAVTPTSTHVAKQVTHQAAMPGAVNKATSNVPTLIDSLASNTNGRWAEDQTGCFFRNSSYHAYVQQSNFLRFCPLLGQQVSDATVEVDVTLLSGNNAGLLLRVSGEQFYDFEINSQGQFFFRRHDTGAENYIYLIQATTSNAILPVGQKNTLLVIAHGPSFKLYINNNLVGEVQDRSYTSGQLALAAGTLAPTSIGEGSFNNFKLF